MNGLNTTKYWEATWKFIFNCIIDKLTGKQESFIMVIFKFFPHTYHFLRCVNCTYHNFKQMKNWAIRCDHSIWPLNLSRLAAVPFIGRFKSLILLWLHLLLSRIMYKKLRVFFMLNAYLCFYFLLRHNFFREIGWYRCTIYSYIIIFILINIAARLYSRRGMRG